MLYGMHHSLHNLALGVLYSFHYVQPDLHSFASLVYIILVVHDVSVVYCIKVTTFGECLNFLHL